MTCIAREIQSAVRTPNRTGIDRRVWARSNSTSWHAYNTSNPPTQAPIGQTVEAHRGAARGNHSDEDPAHGAPSEGHVTGRQQRARERERQREHGVAEAHERQVDADALEHHSIQRTCSGWMPVTRY